MHMESAGSLYKQHAVPGPAYGPEKGRYMIDLNKNYYIDGKKVTGEEAQAQEERNRKIIDGDISLWNEIKWIYGEELWKQLEAEGRPDHENY